MDGTQFGRYRLVSLLGRGGMGEVWRAYDTGTDRVVALKVLTPRFAEDPVYEQRFRREAHAAARLHNPHVVPIHDYGEIDGRLFVTMALIEGHDLAEEIARGPLAPARAVGFVDQIARALHTAHRVGLVHRDVKPSNILVDQDDNAYLIDFGIARAATDTKLTSAGATIGTWAYMAPERFRTDQVDPRGDIYALACVLHESLTGLRPYPGDSMERQVAGHLFTPPPRPSQLRPDLPPALDDVVATGMAKEAKDRYPSTRELAAAARDAITRPTPRPAAPPPERPRGESQTVRLKHFPPAGKGPAGPSGTKPGPPPAGAPPAAAATALGAPPPPSTPATRVGMPPNTPAAPPRDRSATQPQAAPPTPPPTPVADAEPATAEPPAPKSRRTLVLAIVAVLAVALVAVGAVVVLTSGADTAEPADTTAAETEPPAPDPGTADPTSVAPPGFGEQVALPFTGLAGPSGIAADNADNLFVADENNNRVLMLGSGADMQTALPFTGLSHPTAVALDVDRNIYVSDERRVVRLAAGTNTQTVLPFTGLGLKLGVAVDPVGAVYVSDHDNNRVLKLDKGAAEASEMPFSGLANPRGIAVDAGNNVFVTDAGNKRVVKLPFEAGETVDLPFAGLDIPDGVAVDSNGTVYVTDVVRNKVFSLAQDATAQAELPLTGLDKPEGVAIDSSGNVVVTDFATNRVVRLPIG